jgi:carbonic anhydrase
MPFSKFPVSVVVMCIDYRFWPHALPILQKKYGVFDLIEIAGGAKSLVSPLEEEDRTTLLENIEISIKLHKAKQLILTNHIDCGAYKGSKKFNTHEKEILFHENELRQAKIIARAKFPKLEIKTFIVDKNNKDKIYLTEVS